MKLSFLMLQGTASPFFRQLGRALLESGHTVLRVNFCGGDQAYSGGETSWNYTHRQENLSGWYDELLRKNGYSDILLFGDCRAIHQPMHLVAPKHGARVHVFEEGYVRPHWLTLERHGVNGRSRMPRDPDWFLAQRPAIPASPVGEPTGYNLYERAWHDIRYRAANALYAVRFPHYRSHRPHNGYVEYAGLTLRFAHEKHFKREAEQVTAKLLASNKPYYLFPLQLNSDSQIQCHSPFNGIDEAIEQVVRSFAEHAPGDAQLVIKNHPLDTGLINHRAQAQWLSQAYDLADRIHFIEAGNLPTLLDRARGVVVINSTVGLSALHHRRPLITLGTAIYDMPRLTWQGPLDHFWQEAEGPDMALYQIFLDYVIHHTQINGDFYTRSGIPMAVAGAVQRLEAAYD